MSLTQDDIDILKKAISEEIEIAVKNRFKPVLSKLDSILGLENTQINDTSEDRKMFAEMVSSQAKVEKLSEQVLEIVSHQTNRIVDRVVEQTNDAIETATDKVAESVEPVMATAIGKIKRGEPLMQKKSFWDFLPFFRFFKNRG